MIGIDVGGANLKVADGRGITSYYCPLYEGAPLTRLLSSTGPEKPILLLS